MLVSGIFVRMNVVNYVMINVMCVLWRFNLMCLNGCVIVIYLFKVIMVNIIMDVLFDNVDINLLNW